MEMHLKWKRKGLSVVRNLEYNYCPYNSYSFCFSKNCLLSFIYGENSLSIGFTYDISASTADSSVLGEVVTYCQDGSMPTSLPLAQIPILERVF